MEMSGAVVDGIIHPHVPLEPLVQIARLGNVGWDPSAIFGLSGINVVAGERLERSVQGINVIWILLARLPGPTDCNRRWFLRLPVMTK